jgi:anti-anti-sigma factor
MQTNGTPKVEYVTLVGEFGVEHKERLTAILREAESADVVVLDCEGVSYFDSTALNSLVSLRKRMLEHDRQGIIRIMHPSKLLKRVLNVTLLDSIFELYD